MLPLRKTKESNAFSKASSIGKSIKVLTIISIITLFLALFGTFSKDSKKYELYADCTTVKLSELLAVGLQLSEKSASEIKQVKKEHIENMKVKGLTAEGVIEPVTEADQRSNKILVNGFRNHFPNIAMLSEETEPEVDKTIRAENTKINIPTKSDRELELGDLMVLVDPLDATKEFTEDLLEYVTVMVCYVYKGRPIAGIINQVFDPEPAVVGIVGSDSSEGYLQGRNGWHRATGNSAHTITLSRSHTGSGEDIVSQVFPEFESLHAGGSGFKSLLVLDGNAAAYIHVTKIKSWDVCAPDAIIHSVGGEFTDKDGTSLKYEANNPVFKNGIVAAQSKIDHKWYVEKLKGYEG